MIDNDIRYRSKEAKSGNVGHLRGHAKLGMKHTQCGKVIGHRFAAGEIYSQCGACSRVPAPVVAPTVPIVTTHDRKVIIEVRGGVAHLVRRPADVEVIINDYD